MRREIEGPLSADQHKKNDEEQFFPGSIEMRRRLEVHSQKEAICRWLAAKNVAVSEILWWPEKRSMTLSNTNIIRHMIAGNIIIEPFESRNLTTSSYDLTIGDWYFREQEHEPGTQALYSPYDEEDVRRIWGQPKQAVLMGERQNHRNIWKPGNIRLDEKVIFIPPGETFLCHTREFAGGQNVLTTMMKARSSMGRNFIEICKCAGWGDVGYINRWTMEITNNSRYYTIPLPVGRRVAQLVFFETGVAAGIYSADGKYQSTPDIRELEAKWIPDSMIPKMWKDWEVRREGIDD